MNPTGKKSTEREIKIKNLSYEVLSAQLKENKACGEAREYIDKNKYDLKTAWENCPRADWMLWLLARSPDIPKTTVVRLACACARTALKYVPEGENRPLKAIEAAEKWVDNPTAENFRAAANAGDAAYTVADAAYTNANFAAYAAAYAASQVIADAADAAARAAARAAFYDATHDAAQKEMINIIRSAVKIKK